MPSNAHHHGSSDSSNTSSSTSSSSYGPDSSGSPPDLAPLAGARLVPASSSTDSADSHPLPHDDGGREAARTDSPLAYDEGSIQDDDVHRKLRRYSASLLDYTSNQFVEFEDEFQHKASLREKKDRLDGIHRLQRLAAATDADADKQG